MVATHQVRPFTLPVAPAPVATQARNNDNLLRQAYNTHDADATMHNQSGPVASRPAAPPVGSVWYATDSGAQNISLYTATGWVTIAGVGVGVTGSGTAGTLTKWSSTSALTNSLLTESGTTVTATGTLAATTAVATPIIQRAAGSAFPLTIRTIVAGAEIDFQTNSVTAIRIDGVGTPRTVHINPASGLLPLTSSALRVRGSLDVVNVGGLATIFVGQGSADTNGRINITAISEGAYVSLNRGSSFGGAYVGAFSGQVSPGFSAVNVGFGFLGLNNTTVAAYTIQKDWGSPQAGVSTAATHRWFATASYTFSNAAGTANWAVINSSGITGTLLGSAATLTTPRTFSLTGAVTATGVTFDGSADVALSTTLAVEVPRFFRVPSAVTNATTTLSTITSLAIALAASARYYVKYVLLVQTDDVTNGPRVALTFGAATRFAATARVIVDADGIDAEMQGAMTSSGDEVIFTGLPATATNYVLVIEGVIENDATPRTLDVQYASETAGTITVDASSYVMYGLLP
jgi:hypothetical protein